MTLYLLLAYTFLVIGGALEFKRGKPDTFTLIALTFAVAFVFAPSVLHWASPDDVSFSKFVWMRDLPKAQWPYLMALALVISSYLSVYLGFRISGTAVRIGRDPSALTYMIVGLAFTMGGLIAFYVFLEVVGGPVEAFRKAWLLRIGTPDDLPLSKFAFIKRLSFFVVPGSIFLLQAASRRTTYWPIAIVGVFAAVAVITFMNGRLQLVEYIVPLFLALIVIKERPISKKALAGAGLACLIFGAVGGTKMLMQPSAAFVTASNAPSFVSKTQQPLPEPRPDRRYLPQEVVSIGLEFAFPFCNVLSVVTTNPNPRWFTDLVLPFFHLIPKRLVPIADYLPPRLYELNTLAQAGEVPWGIPVDLISFGYFSLGLFGVIITSFGFGWLARRIELMMPRGNYGDDVFRFSWIVLVASLVMYGDPNWLVVEQFHWLVALFTYLAITHPAAAAIGNTLDLRKDCHDQCAAARTRHTAAPEG